jgi:hypothetical protein
MESGFTSGFKMDDLIPLAIMAAVAVSVSLIVSAAFFYWFRREQRRAHKNLLKAIAAASQDPDNLIVTGNDILSSGELVAQFKVNHGKQVVSLLESDGRRFIHVDGELSAPERARMVRYLKSEGFMS